MFQMPQCEVVVSEGGRVFPTEDKRMVIKFSKETLQGTSRGIGRALRCISNTR